MKKPLYFFLFLTTLSMARAQLLDVGQSPPSVKWHYILTSHFQVIYAFGFEKEAQRMANTLEYLYLKEQKTLPTHPKRIPILLQNQGIISNGYVRLAPRMSEFYATPPQEFETNDWLNTLALHELRHVFQFDVLEHKLRFIPFAETLTMAAGLPIPFWFFEGDAVVQETALSNSGRGRLPSWEMEFRANVLSGRDFSYSKYYLDSYKDIVPDYYRMGYFMVSKIRRDKGSVALQCFVDQPFGFLGAFKKATGGFAPKQYFKNTVEELKQLWQEQLRFNNATAIVPFVAADKKHKMSYLLPQKMENGSVVALQTSFDQVPQLVTINAKKEIRTVFKMGYQEQNYFNLSHQVIVWDETRKNPRFARRNYSVICSYSFETKKRKQLTFKSRFFSPALSPDAKRIVVVDIAWNNVANLVELDTETGKELKRYSNTTNVMFQTPKFSLNGEEIIASVVSKDGKSLALIDRKTGEMKFLLPFSNQQIAQPILLANQHVVFKAHYNGIDNLYDLDIQSNDLKSITNAQFGAFSPFFDVDKNEIWYNDYQADGYGVATVTYSLPIVKQNFTNTFIDYAKPVVSQEFNGNVLKDSLPTVAHPSLKYKEFSHLFNFHSMLPLYDIAANYSTFYTLGIRLQSDNLLNTTSFATYFEQNIASGMPEYGASVSYKKYLPVLTLYYDNRGVAFPDYTYRYQQLSAEVSVPVSFNRFNVNYSGYVSVAQNYTHYYGLDNSNYHISASHYFSGTLYSMQFQGMSRMAKRDLYPKFGASAKLLYSNYPFTTNADKALTVKTLVYLPGIMSNHGISLSFNYLNIQGSVDYFNIPYVWGYSYFSWDKKRITNTLLSTYTFPIAYPDWNLDTYFLLNAYVKRLRGTLMCGIENIHQSVVPKTYGMQLMADLHVLRFVAPISVGCQFLFSPFDPNNRVYLPVIYYGF